MAAAGIYIVESDVDDLWGTSNVTDWSDLNAAKARDENRIQRAIDYAEARINGDFRRLRYAIPFVFAAGITDRVVVWWAAAFAGQWLYQARGLRDEAAGERIAIVIHGDDTTGEEGVMDSIRRYLAGQSYLDARQVETQPSVPTVVR